MSGFTELTSVVSFDELIAADQYGGTVGHAYGNELFIIFKARGGEGQVLCIERSLILEAFSRGYVEIIDHIGSRKYSVSLTESNPENCDFIFHDYIYYNLSCYHVLHLNIGNLSDFCAISVSIKMDDDNYISTAFVDNSLSRSISSSFAII